jgi:hypothetical protein
MSDVKSIRACRLLDSTVPCAAVWGGGVRAREVTKQACGRADSCEELSMGAHLLAIGPDVHYAGISVRLRSA